MVVLLGGHWDKVNHCEKVSDLIGDNPEDLEAINKASLYQHIKGDNLGVNMKVVISVG